MQLTSNLRIRQQFSRDHPQARALASSRPCPVLGCHRSFTNNSGLTQHLSRKHPEYEESSSDHNNSIPPPIAEHLDHSTSESEGSNTSRHRRATVEDVVDEDDIRSSSSRGSNDKTAKHYHSKLNAAICDKNGNFIPANTPPSPRQDPAPTDWGSYESRAHFELAEFLYKDSQMSAGNIDKLFKIWGSHSASSGGEAPFANHKDLYAAIDSTTVGDVPWESFKMKYSGALPDSEEGEIPSWMEDEHEVWFRNPHQLLQNLLSNTDFDGEFDYTPFQEYDESGNHRYQDFMSGNWAWRQADEITKDEATHGAMFVPIILGSDKTTVSVATGHNEYWPIYLSIGNIRNNVRRAHRDGMVLLGFLPIAKADKRHAESETFRNFRRQLSHTSIAKMLLPLQASFTTPEINRCPDGHFRRTIYGAGPYIADYPEQCMLTAVVQGWCPKCMAPSHDLEQEALSRTQKLTNELAEFHELGQLWARFGIIGDIVPFTADFPRADINESISPDILHQLIKGGFKDHIVSWVEDLIRDTHPKKEADRILDEIDYRISLAAPFSGVRRFPKGRGFKQWTGDDSKALMKVYLAAIDGLVPDSVVCAARAFTEFCYLARRNVHDTASLSEMDAVLNEFHEHRKIFLELGIRPDFNLPRQHSARHWVKMIREFGAPNGLCSSITESKHIKAVKKPWRRSSRYKALQQMLYINQRMDKLAAARLDFVRRGMLEPSKRSRQSAAVDKADPGVLAEVQLSSTVTRKLAPLRLEFLADAIAQDDIADLLREFLFHELNPDTTSAAPNTLAAFSNRVSVHPSALAFFHAPSDLCGTEGISSERIRAVPSWQGGDGRYDCVFVETDPDAPGMLGLDVAQVKSFLSFSHHGKQYQCALISWFSRIGEKPDDTTHMWMLEPDFDDDERTERHCSVISVDSIVRAAHLMPIFGKGFTPKGLTPALSLTTIFRGWYVNKFIDHHAFEIAF
ncbi:hypothetical protein FIBSPDRAFT_749065 [Athelia psychrophila]|uniref:C2H2-type domain-containing protein n=1 Tax=Athelia psychrophila TaxID=1759441 RepID=A0A166EYX7_9AGAM|nr:hypothetical protein FIBSPDRAFT_749065 [Fibularhizoctonia sp. CBS 109695]